MKLLFFDDFKLGVLKGETVVDVSDVVRDVPHTFPQDLINGVIARFDMYRPKLEQAAANGHGTPLAQVRVRAPLPRPVNIVCMAVNYMENGARAQPAPIDAFQKSPLTVIGDGDTMVLPDVPATIFEGEAELALVIGKPATNVSEAEAMQYVFGFTNLIDGSARGLPAAMNLFYRMKSRDTFCPIGPYIVTADEVPDPMHLQVRLWNNGALRQDYNTSDMAHNISRCIAWVSSLHTLEPGDLLALGTNHGGLHAFQDGDRIELECAGLGRLHIGVRDNLKRRWPLDTRNERLAQGFGANGAGQPPPQESGKYAPQPAPAS